MKANTARRYGTFLIIALLLFGTVLTMGAVNAQEENKWKVSYERSNTEMLGGGEFLRFRFGTEETGQDAMFGVMWGTDENPNSIHMVTTQARYLARVSVRDQNGKDVDDGERYVKAQSFLGTRIGRIWEYNDTNGDGLCNFTVNAEDELADEGEEVYKYVDLREASWEYSGIEETVEGDNTTYTFSLTAYDLPYHPVNGELSPGMDEEVLDEVSFTFHVTAGVKEVKNREMPQFRVTVRQGPFGGNRLQKVERERSYEFDGKVGMYDMKWDHEINGWDFEPDNQNPALIMGFQNMFGNHLENMFRWQLRFMHQVREDAGASYQDSTGEHTTNFTEQQQLRERRLTQNRIEYGGDWSRAGRFHWVSDVEVDGEQTQMQAQIMGGRQMGFNVRVMNQFRYFQGFALWGGMNYPGGEEIYHDPGVAGSTYLELGVSESDGLPIRGIFLFGAVGIAAVVVIGALILGRKDKDTERRNQYDVSESKKEEEWSDYYDRGK